MNVNGSRTLRLKDVIELTGLSKSTIYDYVKRDLFPKPFAVGLRAIGWREREVTEWLAGREAVQRQS